MTLDRASGISLGLIRTFKEGSLAPSSAANLLVQPNTADLRTNSTLQERRAAATERRAAARAKIVATATAKAVKEHQSWKKRRQDAPVDRPGRGMLVELGLAPRSPSPGEMRYDERPHPGLR